MAKFFNILLIAFAVFCLSFVWLFFYVRIPWLSALCSGGIALVFCLVLYKILPIKTKKYLSKQRKKQLEKFEMYLATHDARVLIAKIFEKKEYEIFYTENGFVANKQSKMLVGVWFGFEKFSKQALVELIKRAKKVNAGCVILFGGVGFNTKPVCTYTQTRLVTFSVDETYSLMEKNNLLPQLPDYSDKKDKQIFVYAFNEKRFPYYVVSSLSLVAISFISFFPIYSIVVATLLLAAAIYSKFNKRYNGKAQFEF